MKEKEPQNFEKLFSNELSTLKEIKSLATVTLVTLDTAIPAHGELLKNLGLEPDDWKLVTSKEIDGFLKNFEEVFGESLPSFIKGKENSLRLGGSVFTTLFKLLELKPEIKSAAAFAPIGKENGESSRFDNLVTVVNGIRGDLQSKLNAELNGRLLIQETVSEGITPIILSFYQEKGRSMVLIRDDQEVKIPNEAVESLETPILLLVDARELTQDSYLREAIRLARRPDSFVVLGLGTDSVIPKVVEKIKILYGYTQGETALAGNRGEVSGLLKNWGEARNMSELMLETGLRFLLETNGQNGATAHFRVGENIHSATYAIPKEEVFKGDTTNAGDIFLAYVIKGLMDGPEVGRSMEYWLYMVLKQASKGTLRDLQERD